MSASEPSIDSNTAFCPRCGAAFGCGVDTAGCWCTRLPPIDATRLAGLDPASRAALGLPADAVLAGCLCPDCLALLVEALAMRHQAPSHGELIDYTEPRETK